MKKGYAGNWRRKRKKPENCRPSLNRIDNELLEADAR